MKLNRTAGVWHETLGARTSWLLFYCSWGGGGEGVTYFTVVDRVTYFTVADR